MDLKGLDQGWGRGNKGVFIEIGTLSHNFDLKFAKGPHWAGSDTLYGWYLVKRNEPH